MKYPVKLFMAMAVLSASSWASSIQVQLVKPEVKTTETLLTLTGTIEAKQNSALTVLQSGVVAELFVEQGDSVLKGQKLLALNSELAIIELEQLNAELNVNKLNVAEKKRLFDETLSLKNDKLIAETTTAQRKSELSIAKAQLAQTTAKIKKQQEVINRHVLYAPFSGIVAERNIDLGEWVTQQTTAFSLVEDQNLRLKLSIPQEYYSQISNKLNVPVTVTLDAQGATTHRVKLTKLVSAANPINRAFTALVDLGDIAGLAPGMSAVADVVMPEQDKQVLWLPKSAIKVHPDGGYSVFYIHNRQAKRRLVKAHENKGELIGVIGAESDKQYISTGVELLQDGQQVIIKGTQP